MQIRKNDYYFKDYKKKIINIYPFSCMHLLSSQCDLDKLEEFIREVESDPYSITLGLGDYTDWDKHTVSKTKRLLYQEYPDISKDLDNKIKSNILDTDVLPIFDRLKKAGLGCAGLLSGNHKIIFTDNTNSDEYICKKTGIPYLGEGSAFIGLFFRNMQKTKCCKYVIYAEHGHSGASTLAADINQVQKKTQFYSDMIVMGHTHKGWGTHICRVAPNAKFDDIVFEPITLIRAGAFRKGIVVGKTDYSEKYPPAFSGYTKASLTLQKTDGLEITKVQVTT